MRILWIVNLVLPEAAHLAGGNKVAFGGWVSAMLQQLTQVPGVELGVVMRGPVQTPVKELIGSVLYYLLPQRDKFDIAEADCRFALEDFRPDLLHVEGTESAQAHRFLDCWQGKNVVSLQGIINGYEPHQYGGLPVGEMLLSFHPIKAMVAAAMIANKHLFFKPRLAIEIETIRKAQNILGRTTWDRAHAYAINPDAFYFSCNRILRKSFYQMQWDIPQIQRHSIFIGNSSTPLKGAHFVLSAVSQLKREYTDIKLYIAGESALYSSWKEWKKMVGYAAYLRYLIKTLGISKHVEFTGILQAEQMAERLCSVNAYVLCSTIENSPNTLGEAMSMGVPAVAAFVGGAPDMARDNEEVLFYRDNDPQLLAYQLKRIFDDDSLALRLSWNARKRAQQTHDPQENLRKLLHAYHTIMGNSTQQQRQTES